MNNARQDLIGNRQIRVFISSTFQDMQDERDYLMKRTFPKLRKLAAERDVTLTELDLRWGITEEEAKTGKVVEICLREIENSIPFFIGIIGNRYGWVPEKDDLSANVTERFPDVNTFIGQHLSVTEMEMQFGVLQREEDMHAYFYIKDKMEDQDNPEMLNRLKAEVEASRYPSSTYSSPENLAEQVEQAFIALLDQLFPEGNISELEKERIGQRSFMHQLCQNYIRDERNFQALDEWLNDRDCRQMVVTGASGMGKSALIANWLNEKLSDENCDYNIVYHFTSNGGSESSHEHIKTALSDEIADIYGWNATGDNGMPQFSSAEGGQKENKDDKLDKLFLRVAGEGDKPLLIVLDAVNQIVDNDNAKLLNWLPVPPRKVKILFSTLEADRTMQVFRNRNYPVFTLQPLDIANRKRLIEGYLGQFAKKLTPENVERIAGDRQCENTMVLKTLLDELINYGVYEKIGDRIEYYLSQETIEDFYQALLQSHEDEFGRDIVTHALSLIAVSKNGLSEDEILAVLNHGSTEDNPRVARLYWSQFLCAFMSHTVTNGGIITFSHSYILYAVEERYLQSDNNYERTCREEIVRLTESQETARAFAEKAWQLFNLIDHKRLHEFLLNIKVFDSLYKSDEFGLGQYWRELMAKGYNLSDYKLLLDDADIKSCNNISGFCRAIMADYDTARQIAEISLQKAREKFGEDSKETAKSYNNIGIVYFDKGEYDKALEHHLKALDIRKKVLGTEHPDTAMSYYNIASAYGCEDDFYKALEFHLKAHEINEKVLGTAHPATADFYNNVGQVYGIKGDSDKALECFLKALEILEKTLGMEHPDTASSYNRIGGEYWYKGDYDKMLEYYLKALEIREKVLGAAHPDTASSYNNIGVVYSDKGDYDNALEFHQKALEIREKVFGAEHPATETSCHYIGNVYEIKGDYDKALEYYLKALAVKEKVLGTEHPATADSYSNIGNLYGNKGDYDKALEYRMKALEFFEKVLGTEHPDTAGIYNDVAWLYHLLNRYEEALPYIEKAINVFPDDVNCIDTLATVYQGLGRHDEALAQFEHCLQLMREQAAPKYSIQEIKDKIASLKAMMKK
ncbi:Tetratricopeptide (TPR) repeat [Prevotella sp. khp1]|uniref:tetratricopeptide repeat protein n=1 Tax=Prevotellaceae TaxID=171552 RepID=UPI00088D9892|nr:MULTISPECIES: tetratricopeptide repeat protein [Prevotellaceae]QVJ81666.1 tetratricopeptide repeat protein [Xylanibacter ruminicola]SDQ55541.1 Tetratricopeptide (TPR) repeat [Prevotella sp. khp1]